jgi:hypothetical protein
VDNGRIEEVLALVKMTAVAEAVLHPRVAARVVQELYGAREEIFNPFLPS